MILTSAIALLCAVATAAVALRGNDKLDAEVLILGGGTSGVSTAKTLFDAGVTDFIVVEAYSELGGRIRKQRFGGYNIELGANEIEGTNKSLGMDHQTNPLWNMAVKKCGLKGRYINEYDDLHVTYRNGSVVNDTELRSRLLRTMDLGIEDSLKLQKNGGKDRSIAKQLAKFGWKPKTSLEHMLDWTIVDLADAQTPEETSTFAALPLPLNQLHGRDDYFIDDKRGYAHFVKCMAEDFLSSDSSRLQLNTTVSAISWSNRGVCVTVHTTGQPNNSERKLCAKYAVVTFSVGVLQSKEGQAMFHPSLPQWKMTAIGKLSFTNYLKIFVKFNETFWNNDVSFIYRVSKDRGYYPVMQPLGSTISKILPSNANILLFFLTEDHALRVSKQPKNITQMQIMEILREIYGNNIPEPEDILVSSWIADPLFRGMFTNVSPGVTDEMYEVAAKPIGNLHFSGEGTCRKYFGTVVGAYVSGIATGNRMLNAMKEQQL